MTGFVEKVIGSLSSSNPDVPAAEAAGAIVNTIADPTPASIISDLELAISLFSEIKTKLQGMPPSVINLLKAIF